MLRGTRCRRNKEDEGSSAHIRRIWHRTKGIEMLRPTRKRHVLKRWGLGLLIRQDEMELLLSLRGAESPKIDLIPSGLRAGRSDWMRDGRMFRYSNYPLGYTTVEVEWLELLQINYIGRPNEWQWFTVRLLIQVTFQTDEIPHLLISGWRHVGLTTANWGLRYSSNCIKLTSNDFWGIIDSKLSIATPLFNYLK